MNRDKLHEILDIEAPEEFEYYENLAALLEADEHIEVSLIDELLRKIKLDDLQDMFESYFEEFTKVIPDELAEFYVTVETAKKCILSGFNENKKDDDYAFLAQSIYDFRNWYVLKTHVRDLDSEIELNVRDARYNLSASRFTGDKCNYDFDGAYEYETEGYSVLVSDMIDAQFS